MLVNYRTSVGSIHFYLVLVFSISVLVYSGECILNVKDPKTVMDLGRNLSKKLTDVPLGTKEDLINDLTDYFIYLNTAFRVEDQSHPLGKEVLQKLKVRGGPPFLGTAVNDEMLANSYGMGVVEIDHVKEVIDDIERLWKDIKNGVLVSPEFENY